MLPSIHACGPTRSRSFLLTAPLLGLLLGLLLERPGVAQEPGALLSEAGCGRATGYAETNKIVTRDGRSHVAWLDSEADGFRVRVRSIEHATGEWTATFTLGEARDNHGGPALAIDDEGHLHVVYHPHHHPFRYRRSLRPNDSSEWTEVEEFGERCTYPSLVVDAAGGLLLTARRSHEDRPWEVELFRRPKDGAWTREGVILRSRTLGYSHFQEALIFSRDHRTLHLSCRVQEGKPDPFQTIGVVRSLDGGRSWQRADGSACELPMTVEELDVLDQAPMAQRRLRCGSIAVDAEGVPHVLYSVCDAKGAELFVASEREGKWSAWPLRPRIQGLDEGWGLLMPGGLCIDAAGHWHLATSMHRAEASDPLGFWGHPSTEVLWLRSKDAGASFELVWRSPADPDIPTWLPSLERPVGSRPTLAPSLMVTVGERGDRNTDLLSNQVRFLGPRR